MLCIQDIRQEIKVERITKGKITEITLWKVKSWYYDGDDDDGYSLFFDDFLLASCSAFGGGWRE